MNGAYLGNAGVFLVQDAVWTLYPGLDAAVFYCNGRGLTSITRWVQLLVKLDQSATATVTPHYSRPVRARYSCRCTHADY